MIKRFSLFSLFLLLNLLTTTLYADISEVVISRNEQPRFAVEKAYFILITGEKVIKVPVQTVLEQKTKTFFATSLAWNSSWGNPSQALLVYGKGGALQFFPFESQPFSQDQESLSAELEKLTASLESWKTQIRVQADTVERLKGDATIVGNIGRIAEKNTELERIKTQARHIETDIANLKHFISLAGGTSQPRNFVKRYTTLNDQLKELAKITRLVEAGESKRKMLGEDEIQQNIRLIEMSRDDDYDALTDSLKQLQQIRQELEEIYNGTSGY